MRPSQLYRQDARKRCDRASVGTAAPGASHQTPSASCPDAGMRSPQRVSSAIPMEP
ncbi:MULTISPECIES: hypothetical protein [Arthrospira]|uniref:hypothetical protein n=1 Tax=Oscillatoriales TaxID=1150 RepID=UPI0013050C06|nr:hypothetical protein [Arthrospira platensis]MBD2669806.1 hypothetical protein [Arthrospira platensis FACHB-439]MDF2208931.1 hypothetical protein [Arthrospira platensis NCB002]QQW29343.1 hypothetical protein AP9108_32275 [Arthrospira sp. PCC 9108]